MSDDTIARAAEVMAAIWHDGLAAVRAADALDAAGLLAALPDDTTARLVEASECQHRLCTTTARLIDAAIARHPHDAVVVAYLAAHPEVTP